MDEAEADDRAHVCHRCGGRVSAGYLQGGQALWWGYEPPTWRAHGARLTKRLGPACLAGYRCETCREITVTY